MRSLRDDEAGQAAVELVALLPFCALAALIAWQLAVAGHAVWSAGGAARAAARAAAVGSDPRAAARRALPPRLERGLKVRTTRSGGVAVTIAIPKVVGSGRLMDVRERARLRPQGP
jgi:pilus assembly protein CpaE